MRPLYFARPFLRGTRHHQLESGSKLAGRGPIDPPTTQKLAAEQHTSGQNRFISPFIIRHAIKLQRPLGRLVAQKLDIKEAVPHRPRPGSDEHWTFRTAPESKAVHASENV